MLYCASKAHMGGLYLNGFMIHKGKGNKQTVTREPVDVRRSKTLLLKLPFGAKSHVCGKRQMRCAQSYDDWCWFKKRNLVIVIFFLCLQSAMFISSFFTVNYLVFLQRITFSGFFGTKLFLI